MAFITASFLIDAPASALNNSGEPIPNARTQNTTSVKFIRGKDGLYPYASAQAFRYWLRDTLETSTDIEWKPAPIYREEKVAYTDANPILYWDDDLLGYMRAPSKKQKDLVSADDPELQRITKLMDDKGEPTTVTRAAPFRVSTLVSLMPVSIVDDWGSMSRHEGDPVPYEHQFYRTTLSGAVSLNLALAGKFYYKRRTGFQNLDAERVRLARENQLEHLEDQRAYRLSQGERMQRISALLQGLGRLQGGAKQSIHYTDVSPVVVFIAVIGGGNNPFSHAFTHKDGKPFLQVEAVKEILSDLDSRSPVYLGWKPGYLPEARAEANEINGLQIVTPRQAFENIAAWIQQNPGALDE